MLAGPPILQPPHRPRGDTGVSWTAPGVSSYLAADRSTDDSDDSSEEFHDAQEGLQSEGAASDLVQVQQACYNVPDLTCKWLRSANECFARNNDAELHR